MALKMSATGIIEVFVFLGVATVALLLVGVASSMEQVFLLGIGVLILTGIMAGVVVLYRALSSPE